MALFVKLLVCYTNQLSRRCARWIFSFRYNGFKKRNTRIRNRAVNMEINNERVYSGGKVN